MGIYNKITFMTTFPTKKEIDLVTLGKWKVTKSASQKYISRKLQSRP